MKTNLTLFSGMIAGSVLTMLAMFILKPTFLSSNNSSNNISNNSYVAESLDSQELASEDSSDEDSVQPAKPCDDDCLDSIINDLVTGKNLSGEFGVSIRENHAQKVAEKLQTQPETVEKIAARLRSLKGQDDRDAILFTFSFFPIEDVEQFAQRLIASENTQNRSDGLSLIYHIIEKSEKSKVMLEQVIKNDINYEMAMDAIQILYGVFPNHPGDISRQRLSQIMSSDADGETRSNALQTKTTFFETNEEVKQDIIKALNSPNQRYQEGGIQILDETLRRQSNGNTEGDWRGDENLRKVIEKIANNADGHPFGRAEALNLMRRHYY